MTSQILPSILTEKGTPGELVCTLGLVRVLASRQVPGTAFPSHVKRTVPLRGAAIAALKSCMYIFLISELEVP